MFLFSVAINCHNFQLQRLQKTLKSKVIAVAQLQSSSSLAFIHPSQKSTLQKRPTKPTTEAFSPPTGVDALACSSCFHNQNRELFREKKAPQTMRGDTFYTRRSGCAEKETFNEWNRDERVCSWTDASPLIIPAFSLTLRTESESTLVHGTLTVKRCCRATILTGGSDYNGWCTLKDEVTLSLLGVFAPITRPGAALVNREGRRERQCLIAKPLCSNVFDVV